MGMKKFKFHCAVHSASDQFCIGPLYSCGSGTGESNHKDHKKKAACHTSMNGVQGFEQDTQKYLHKNCCIDRLWNSQSKPIRQKSKTMDFDCPKASYVVTAEGMFYAKHKRGMVTHAKWNDEALQTQVLSFLQKQVLPFCPCGEINLYTSLNKYDPYAGKMVKYVCNPEYNLTDKRKTPSWHDWADISWNSKIDSTKIEISGT